MPGMTDTTERDDARRYDPLQHDWDSLKHSLTLHPPTSPDVAALMDQFREACLTLGEELLAACPRSRERQIAITHLEELTMWGIKSIACHQAAAVDEASDLYDDDGGPQDQYLQGSASQLRLGQADDG